MKKTQRWLDRASLLTLLVTLVLFVVAMFEKGFTHDLLLEAGVFLVSVKLVLSMHKTEIMLRALDQKLESILRQKD